MSGKKNTAHSWTAGSASDSRPQQQQNANSKRGKRSKARADKRESNAVNNNSTPTGQSGQEKKEQSSNSNPPPPQQPIQPPRNREESLKQFGRNVRAFVPLLSVNQEAALAKLKKMQITAKTHHKSWSGTESPHPVSASIRKLMTVRAFGFIYSEGYTRVFSKFGHDRDRGLCDYINTTPVEIPDEHKLQIFVNRPILVSSDLTRGEDDEEEIRPNDAILIVDVYETPDGHFDPEYVETILNERQILIWIGHRFRGDVGHAFEEGVWARYNDGKSESIVFYPDAVTASYPPHDPCQWIWESNNHGHLSWTVKESFGDYCMVVFKKLRTMPTAPVALPHNYAVQEVEMPRKPSGIIENMVFEMLMYFPPLVKRWWPNEKMVINKEIAEHVSDLLAGRQIGSYAYKGIVSATHEKLKNMPAWKLIKINFPDHFHLTVEKTVIATMLRDLGSRTHLITMTNALNGGQITKYNNGMKALGSIQNQTPTHSTGLLCIVGTLAGLGALFTFNVLKRKVIGNLTPKAMLSAMTHVSSQEWAAMPVKPVFDLAVKNLNEPMSVLDVLVACDICIITPVWEEVVKSIKPPYTGIIFGLLEAALKIRVGGHPVGAALSFTMHALPSGLSYWKRLIIHMTWNALCMVMAKALSPVPLARQFGALGSIGTNACALLIIMIGLLIYLRQAFPKEEEQNDGIDPPGVDPPQTPWEHQRAALEEGKVSLSDVMEYQQGIHSFPLNQRTVLRAQSIQGFATESSTMGVKGEFVGQEEDQDHAMTYWIIPTSFPFFVPGKTDWNLSQIAKHRILVDPPMDVEKQMEQWKHVFKSMLPLLPPKYEHFLKHEEFEVQWFQKFDSVRKKRYAFQEKISLQTEASQSLDSGIELMVKTNEAISKYDPTTKTFRCKPRPIAQVHPILQYAVGPIIYGATQVFKKYWDVIGNQFEFPNGWTIRISWGSGMSDDDLSSWMYSAMLPGRALVLIIVAGDDSLVAVIKNNQVTFFEGDAEKFDQSQSEGPLAHERKVMSHVGVDANTVSLMRAQSLTAYKLRFSDKTQVSILREHHPTRDTGGPNTTFGNTTNMASASADLFIQMPEAKVPTLEEYKKHFADLGFAMKVKQEDSPNLVTFLKGTWYVLKAKPGSYIDQRSWAWGHLPSRFLKIGKSFQNPSILYGLTPYEAAERFLHDQGTSMKNFLQVPVLRAFVAKWNLGRARPLEEWQVQASGIYREHALDPEELGFFMKYRYDIDADEFEEIEKMASLAGPFNFLAHPAFVKLGLVDYAFGGLPPV